jgi:hypothetical protein
MLRDVMTLRSLVSAGAALLALFALPCAGDETNPAQSTSRPSMLCQSVDSPFIDEVWAKVGERICLDCHRPDGDAADSRFVLGDIARDRSHLPHNLGMFRLMADEQAEGSSVLLLKPIGGLEHGGGAVLTENSTEYRILQEFVSSMSAAPSPVVNPDDLVDLESADFFEGVERTSPERLLRRVSLSLAARLPTASEVAAVREHGLDAFDEIVDQMLAEDAFYERLKEGFNDIFLTLGYDGNGEEVLSYHHFETTRLWYQDFPLDVPEEEQERAHWHLADVYRDAMRREPMELIEYIVRNDRPFTEIVTADYIMVSPYTARGYGIFEEMQDQFADPNDPFEYRPARLKALVGRDGDTQESATGYYPHAGLLSTFHYLRRYPTTETNRNRLRARMYYQHFLGIDVMALAPRVSDAAAITAQFEIPTMQAAECVVCHRDVDPVAGLFQDFNEEGHLGPRADGWYSDMFGPGLEGSDLPGGDRWRSLQWLGERTAADPRFATAMVEHVYYILMGRRVLKAPEDINDPRFAAQRRAYIEQRRLIAQAADQFVADGFNLKTAFKSLILSDFYQVDGLQTAVTDPCRLAELDDVGLVRLLTPEQLERKIEAIFDYRWGRLDDQESKLGILYGGIDSQSVTERNLDPSGAMGAIQRIMANEVACENVASDFRRPPAERLLFPGIEATVVPDGDPESERLIREAIVHLHSHILGRPDAVGDPEVERTYQLFCGIMTDAREAEGIEPYGSYFCERVDEQRLEDAQYTLRAWRGVVTYLLRQHDFLYE